MILIANCIKLQNWLDLYTSWFAIGEPDHVTDGDEECVAMFISNAKWTDRSCGQLHPAVCEKPSEINIIKINLKNIHIKNPACTLTPLFWILFHFYFRPVQRKIKASNATSSDRRYTVIHIIISTPILSSKNISNFENKIFLLVVDGYCPTGWIPHLSNCFLIQNQTATWDQASSLCRRQGAQLASISNYLEQYLILSQLPASKNISNFSTN